ncbi:S8 family peptidase [Synechococcus sp. CS-1329]|uniref:S8 family peptidase n=1 Tax=Synechococcus sp. CS-1329 TaxID=2847975 RepID=UPI00223AB499|nr:S8 family peptidase [Synechococcus sp. CS-1329]MCT0218475.1 S8 family peptidase [Synechococcus sp. CS-1329]
MRRALETAWQQAEERRAVAHSSRQGVYLEFSSEPGFNLTLKSLESRQAGIKLLNVRTEGQDGEEITRATVFIPQEKSAHFLQKAIAYATEDNPPRQDGTTTAKNAPLIESIGDVRAAILESSFWQDAPDRLPRDAPEWVEAWLSSEDLNVIEAFEQLCGDQGIELGEGSLSFPERTVRLILANRQQLESLIEYSDSIAEFRHAREVATFFVEQDNADQSEWLHELLERTSVQLQNDVCVLVLDHGVNNGHRLLQPVLPDEDCHAADLAWGTQDDHGHGTLMAGTAAYGDILDCLESGSPIIVRHCLESAKILPPPPEENPRRLWGHFTAQGISRAEIQAPQRKRVICMAVTSCDEINRGRPSSWSGEIDELASGYSDDRRRLIIISAGNVKDPEDWMRFPDSNITCEVQDPAQAWNALTVGAFTEKTHISDPSLHSYRAIAEAGDLSPFSCTSSTWPNRKWPIKPDVCFEGGNVAAGPNDTVFDTDDLKLLSTYRDPGVAQFSSFDATSAASAQAAWMAARLQAEYPAAWPETIRGLIVHSAQWTGTQKRKYLRGPLKSDYYKLAKICGYGVPSLERAISCASNSLSLISEANLQPFDRHETQSRCISKDMHIYRLPWPVDVLQELRESPVQMRVTLSYFVEPSPGEIGWKDRYRYASHALRFELNGPGEDEEEFVQRINRRAREDDEHPGTEGAADHWRLGEIRNVGSIHSDLWSGTAVQLAGSNLIAVHPAVGWWRERAHLGRFQRQTRYSLIVSFTLPGQEIDIYTPVAVQLGIPMPIGITI